MRTPTLETKSLILRPLTIDDSKLAYERWTSDPDVARFMPYITHKSEDETRSWLQTVDIDSDTAYDFAICVKAEDDYLCGSCGLYQKEDGIFYVGYNLAKDHWRRGYGTEVMDALVTFAVKTLKQTTIIGEFEVGNDVSGHVMNKLGFEYVGQREKIKLDGVTKYTVNELRYNITGVPQEVVIGDSYADPVGFGTFMASQGAVTDALNVGYRYFDTASFYKNEEMIGKELKASGLSRDEIFLASKIWPSQGGYENTFKAFEESIGKLQTDYLDLYLIHWPKIEPGERHWKQRTIETWKAMEELKEQGKIREIGVSNFLPHHLNVILSNCDIKPAVDQLELHIGYMQHYTLNFCRENGIALQAWSPLGRGRLKDSSIVSKIADKYMVTPSKLCLRFLVQQGISVIPKATDISRMRDNLDIYNFTIDDEDMSLLNSIPEVGFSGEFPDFG